MIAIYKRELKSYFHSMIGWLFVAAALFFLGIYFTSYNLLNGYPFMSYAVASATIIFLITIPILTMKILAEERKNKTDQLILTAPISVTEIVLGKFFAVSTIFSIPVIVICFYPLILRIFGNVPFSESYIAILGFYLFGLTCIAIGTFVSSLTENQVIAAVLSFAIILVGYIMSGISSLISSTGNIITKILSAYDLQTRFYDFMEGTLNLTDVVYFLSVIVLLLFLTIQSILKRRYSISSKNIQMGAYSIGMIVIMFAIVFGLNLLVSTIPSRYTQLDLTSNKMYSITERSKAIAQELKEDVTIYVLQDEASQDPIVGKTVERFNDLSKHITVKYINPNVNPNFHKKYTESSISLNSLIVESAKRYKVIDFADMYETQIDYTTYTSNTTGYDGEGQITSAIAYVTSDNMSKAYTITGHDELTLDNSFLNAIKKENVELGTLELLKIDAIPNDAECIIINAPTKDYSEQETQKVLEYLEKGGNAIINVGVTTDPLPNLNSILMEYGMQVENGIILEGSKEHYTNNPFYLLPNIESDELTSDIQGKYYVFAPYAQNIVISDLEEDNVTVTKLLTTSEDAYSRNNVSDSTDFAKQEGDLSGPFTIGAKSTKEFGETNSSMVVFSCENLFTDTADQMVSGTNLTLFTKIFSSFISETNTSVSIPVKSYEVSYVTIPSDKSILISSILTLCIPVITIVIGLVIWWKRRKK